MAAFLSMTNFPSLFYEKVTVKVFMVKHGLGWKQGV